MAEPTFALAGSIYQGTGGVNVYCPAGTLAGDLLIVVVETAHENVPTPAGMTLIYSDGTGTPGASGSVGLDVFWSVAASPGASIVAAIADPGDHVIARCFNFRGALAAGSPIDGVVGSVEGTMASSYSIQGSTTSVDEELVVVIAAWGTGTSSNFVFDYSADLTITQRANDGTSSGVGGGFYLGTAPKATAGAYDRTNGNTASGTTKQASLTFGIKPVAATFNPAWAVGANQ